MNRLLDRLEFLQGIGLDEAVLVGVPPHRVARLRRQGEPVLCGGFAGHLGRPPSRHPRGLRTGMAQRRTDAIVETHDRIVGKTWREAKSAM